MRREGAVGPHRPLVSSMSLSSMVCSALTCLGVMLISGSSIEFITAGASFIVATVQGLTLLHCSAQRKHFLRDRGCLGGVQGGFRGDV